MEEYFVLLEIKYSEIVQFGSDISDLKKEKNVFFCLVDSIKYNKELIYSIEDNTYQIY